jgi:hypothetical protein
MLATGLLQISQAEVQAFREELQEQVKHPVLSEYAVGTERYESLIKAMERANQFSSPREVVFNV